MNSSTKMVIKSLIIVVICIQSSVLATIYLNKNQLSEQTSPTLNSKITPAEKPIIETTVIDSVASCKKTTTKKTSFLILV